MSGMKKRHPGKAARRAGRLAILWACLCAVLSGCAGERRMQKYTAEWLDLFDTQIRLTAFASDPEEFDRAAGAVYALLAHLDAVFDAYGPHEGVQGVWAVNAAGGETVWAEPELVELLAQALEWSQASGGAFNPAMGSVLFLWHEARQTASLPEEAALREAGEHMDASAVTVDREKGTICLGDPQARLDLGAVAKGWALARAAELLDASLPHYLLDGGGNIVCGLAPCDGRDAWSVGVRDPLSDDAGACVQVLRLTSCAAVTSGGYQRCVEIDGVRYHHLIDPETLYPANRHLQTTVLCADSGLADFLSTAAFVLPGQQARELAGRYGAECLILDAEP